MHWYAGFACLIDQGSQCRNLSRLDVRGHVDQHSFLGCGAAGEHPDRIFKALQRAVHLPLVFLVPFQGVLPLGEVFELIVMNIRVDKQAVDVPSDRREIRAKLTHGSQHAVIVAVTTGIGEHQGAFGVDHEPKVHTNILTGE